MEALLPVTTLPCASSTLTTGCVASRAALAPPTGGVVTANWVAAPAVTRRRPRWSSVRPVEAKVSV